MIDLNVISLKTKVVSVKELSEGCGISYEHTSITERNSVISTIPIGYGDGYPFIISN
jgi:alanine racemase